MYSQEVLAAPLAMANYTRNPPACPRRMGGFFYPYLLFKSSPLTPGSSQHSARSGCLAAGYWVPVAALQALVAHPLPRIGIYPAADLKSALRPSQSPKDAVACYCVLASIAFLRTNAKLGGSAPYNPCSASIEKAPQNLGGFFCNLGKVARLFV